MSGDGDSGPPRDTSGARIEAIKTRGGRVKHIAHLMASGLYYGYETRLELAKAWKCTEAAIRHYAAEAHRVVEFDPAEREQLRRSLAGTCLDILRDAQMRVNKVTDLPDYRAQLDAIEKFAKFAGIEIESSSFVANGPAMRVIVTDDDEGKGGGADGST